MDPEVKKTIEKFFSSYPLRHFEKGQILLRPDEKLSDIFYLVEGQIVEYDISPNGNEIVLNAFKPVSLMPLSNALNRNPNRYFFEAANSVTVRQAPVGKVMEFLKSNPNVVFDLLARVYRGTDGLMRRMAHLMGSNAEGRAVFELLNAARRFGKRTRDGSIMIPLTESDLAKRSGLARETLSRAIQSLKQAGLVRITSRGIVVPNLQRLEEASDSGL